MALTFAGAALEEHAKLIDENIEELKRNLANKPAVPDYADYCYRAGQIAGLRIAADLCEEALKRVIEK